MNETAMTAGQPHIDQIEKRLSGLRDDLGNILSRIISVRDALLGSQPIAESAIKEPPINGGFIGNASEHLLVLERTVSGIKDVLGRVESSMVRSSAR